jgi:sensor c-di-GMP phosphodiesterase-like protein
MSESCRIAKRLKLSTVAEGIETEEQLALLKSLGCERGQGWLFARAMEFQAAMTWVSKSELAHPR